MYERKNKNASYALYTALNYNDFLFLAALFDFKLLDRFDKPTSVGGSHGRNKM